MFIIMGAVCLSWLTNHIWTHTHSKGFWRNTKREKSHQFCSSTYCTWGCSPPHCSPNREKRVVFYKSCNNFLMKRKWLSLLLPIFFCLLKHTILKIWFLSKKFNFGKTLLWDIFKFFAPKFQDILEYFIQKGHQKIEFSCQKSRFSPKIGLYKH